MDTMVLAEVVEVVDLPIDQDYSRQREAAVASQDTTKLALPGSTAAAVADMAASAAHIMRHISIFEMRTLRRFQALDGIKFFSLYSPLAQGQLHLVPPVHFTVPPDLCCDAKQGR